MANNDTEKSDRWTEFNLIIDNEKLTHDEKLLLLIIFRYVNNGSKKSYPSIETLKRVYGTKRNETIFNKLKNLYSKGYLIKNQGFQNRNEYTIVFPKNEPCTENVSSNEKRNEVLPKNGRIVCPENGKQKENKKKRKENIQQQEKGYDEIINSYTENEELKNTIFEFIKMRKANKKVMTDKAVKLILGKLDKLANNDIEKIEILNQSIVNSWQGVFPLKSFNKTDKKENWRL